MVLTVVWCLQLFRSSQRRCAVAPAPCLNRLHAAGCPSSRLGHPAGWQHRHVETQKSAQLLEGSPELQSIPKGILLHMSNSAHALISVLPVASCHLIWIQLVVLYANLNKFETWVSTSRVVSLQSPKVLTT